MKKQCILQFFTLQRRQYIQ